jgi:hypothetical protein
MILMCVCFLISSLIAARKLMPFAKGVFDLVDGHAKPNDNFVLIAE